MARAKSIYPLKGIFSNLLAETEKSSFLIPTYQRGYKWAALNGEGQVDILLRDLYNAFKLNSARYYLQFLTLKAREHELEVIDGQQRLTTLTILFSILSHRLGLDSCADGKLKYQTRQNFIEKYIYNDIDALLTAGSWDAFRTADANNDNQDVYFIYHAASAIDSFITEKVSDEIEAFDHYISNKVFLIVNLLEESLNSEKVFINVNKGVKLNDEDLVKGLLVTKLPLDHLSKKYRVTEIEINEWRTNLGRQWDDLVNWAGKKEILSFFKEQADGNTLEWLIHLAYPDIPAIENDHPMFDHFNELYTQKKVTAGALFNSIRDTKMMLNDWYSEPEIANLLGFILHASKSPRKELIWQQLKNCQTRADIISYLKQQVKNLLPLDESNKLKKDLNYEEHGKDIFNVFLILDVIKFLPVNGRKPVAYDFVHISSGNWSLEHIFPQNARDLKKVRVLSELDLSIVKELVTEDRDSLKTDQSETGQRLLVLYDKIRSAEGSCVINADEVELLGKLLGESAPELHRIGNLALLERNINSSLSNHFFNEKRKRLAGKVSEGQFVPFHTYDVFSKLVFPTKSGLQIWSQQDIGAHELYIHKQIEIIISYLES